MEIAQTQTSARLTIARHIAGMAIVALANPLIYFDSSPIEAWAMLPVGAIAIAVALFGVLALLSPSRARAAFPSTPIKSAWLILVLMLLANWQSAKQPPETPVRPAHTSVKPACKPGTSDVDAFLDGCQR